MLRVPMLDQIEYLMRRQFHDYSAVKEPPALVGGLSGCVSPLSIEENGWQRLRRIRMS